MMRSARTACAPSTAALLAATGLALALASGASWAASRKPRHPVPSVTSRDIEREATGTIAPKTPAAPVPIARDDDEPLPSPFHLPSASRKRMRDCGLKWQAMKMSGEAGDDVWRSFATRCLAASAGPFDKSSNRQAASDVGSPPPAADR